MQSLCAKSTSMLLSRAVVMTTARSSNTHRGSWALFLAGTSLASPIVALCEDKHEIVKRDAAGNIDWGKTVSRIPQGEFWDDVARAAGANVQGAIDSGIPTQLSYGFLMGFCSGYALKKVGKIAATVAGLGFVTLQSLQYAGYVSVDHNVIKKDVESYLDLNKDGKLDHEDRKIATDKVMEVLQIGMPSGGGFVVGFVGGLRSG